MIVIMSCVYCLCSAAHCCPLWGDSPRNDRDQHRSVTGDLQNKVVYCNLLLYYSAFHSKLLDIGASPFTHISWYRTNLISNHSPSFTEGGISVLYAFTNYVLLVLVLLLLVHVYNPFDHILTPHQRLDDRWSVRYAGSRVCVVSSGPISRWSPDLLISSNTPPR